MLTSTTDCLKSLLTDEKICLKSTINLSDNQLSLRNASRRGILINGIVSLNIEIQKMYKPKIVSLDHVLKTLYIVFMEMELEQLAHELN